MQGPHYVKALSQETRELIGACATHARALQLKVLPQPMSVA
jgi:hypothetical protein